MAGLISFTLDIPDFIADPEGAVRRGTEFALGVASQEFKEQRLPHRFDGTMTKTLGWKDRTAKYEKSKAARGLRGVHHRFTGHARAVFLRGARIMARRGFLGVRLPVSQVLSKAGVAYYKIHYRPNRPNLRKELRMITAKELLDMAASFKEKLVLYLMTDPRARRKKRVVKTK